MATAPTTNDNGSAKVPPPEELRAKPFKKICIILLSFIAAVALLSITNVILAHMFVASAALFPPKPKAVSSSSQPPTPSKPKGKSNKKPQPKVETKTVYVPPTKEDLDRIRQELETSDPLPPITKDDNSQRSMSRVQSIITSTEALMNQRDEVYIMAKQEIDDLAETFASFVTRLEQITWRDDISVSDATAKLLKEDMPSLTSILGRTTFMDLDRQELMQLFTLATEELQWLLNAEEPLSDAQKTALFLNVNNALLTIFTDETTQNESSTNSTCQTSYLALDQGKPSIEFTPPKIVTKKSEVKDATTKPIAPPISNETARESDLYALVENIKNILSRRDLSSVKLDENESMPSPISDKGVDEIRSQISPMVNTIRKKWDSVLTQENNIREYWVGRTEEDLRSGGGSIPSDGEGGLLCSSPDLVEGMVKGGLETVRRKGDLRAILMSTVLASVADDPDKSRALNDDIMKEVVVPEIDYENSPYPPRPPGASSSWKLGKKSISYIVDGPLLHRGVVGWIDSFVDAISGYNDNVDALLDWVVGDEGGSVGTSLVDAFSKILLRIPFPEGYVEQLKKSGILAGRARSILEE